MEIPRKIKPTNRFDLANNVSPYVIEKSIKFILSKFDCYNYPVEVSYNNLTLEYLLNSDKRNLDEKIRYSILRSFTFNTKKFNKYHYFTAEEEENYDNKNFHFEFINTDIIDFLNSKTLSEIRFLILDLQNKQKIKNFSGNRFAEIISNNFQTLNNNQSNSTSMNRKFIDKISHVKSGKNSLYYTKSSIVEKSVVDLYL